MQRVPQETCHDDDPQSRYRHRAVFVRHVRQSANHAGMQRQVQKPRKPRERFGVRAGLASKKGNAVLTPRPLRRRHRLRRPSLDQYNANKASNGNGGHELDTEGRRLLQRMQQAPQGVAQVELLPRGPLVNEPDGARLLWVDTVEKVPAKEMWNSNLKRTNPATWMF